MPAASIRWGRFADENASSQLFDDLRSSVTQSGHAAAPMRLCCGLNENRKKTVDVVKISARRWQPCCCCPRGVRRSRPEQLASA
jgi:hypothetical protein